MQKYLRYFILFFTLWATCLFSSLASSSEDIHFNNKSTQELFNQAISYEEQGKYLDAIKTFSYCLLLIEDHEIAIKGKTNNLLSDLYWRNGNNSKALESGIKALDIFEYLQDNEAQSEALNRLVQIYISEGDFNRAEELLDKVKQHIAPQEQSLNRAEYIRLQGVLLFYKEAYQQALNTFKQSLSIHQHLNESIEVSIDLGNIAESFEKLNELDSAIYYYNKAEHLQALDHFTSGLIFINYGIGKVFIKQKKYPRAIEAFQESIQLMNTSGEKRELPYVFGLLADVYAETEQYDQAFTYQKKQSFSHDSIIQLEKQKRFDELKAEHQVEKAWEENKILRAENTIQNEQLQSNDRIIRLQKVVLAFIIFGLILSIIFTFVFFKSQRRLKTANRTRDKLFSIIAHDLRGPIGNAKGVIELIMDFDPLADQERIKRYLKMMSESLGSTFNLLEELLSWAKAQSHSLRYDPQNLNIKSLVDSTINYLEHASAQKDIHIINKLDANQKVNADQTMTTTVIRNLLSNAIKFSHHNGIIELSAEAKGLFLSIQIKDYGVGIEASKIPQLFDPNSFYSTYGTKNEKGTGLGLILCQEFVKQNKGTLAVESELGKGSTFIFTLPLARI